MKEIEKLNVTRQQLVAAATYYNGCTTEQLHEEEAEKMLDLAAEVLIQILQRNELSRKDDAP